MLNRGARRLSDFFSRYSLELLMVALVVAAIFYSVYDLCFAPAYPIADWLINYTQGFVRRGLPGELILLAARAVHIPPPWMVLVAQIAVYVSLLAVVYRLAKPLRRSMLWYCMMFSPAALAFMILAPENTVRKETLAPAALALTIVLVRRRVPALAFSAILVALLAALVLSHDALFCCFPYIFAAIAVGAGSVKYAAKITAAPYIVAAFLIGFVSRHPGDMSVAIGVCKSVGGRWINADDYRNLCAGAIRHLSWTISDSRHEELANLQYWPLYAALLVLSLAPYVIALVLLYRKDGLRFEVKVIAWIAALSALLSAPLFYLTIDWGRWIQMQVLCMLLMILFVAQRARSFQPDANSKPIGEGRAWRDPLLAGVFLYCTCWTLPVLGMQPVRFGYVEVPLYFHHEFRLMRQLHGWQTIDRGW